MREEFYVPYEGVERVGGFFVLRSTAAQALRDDVERWERGEEDRKLELERWRWECEDRALAYHLGAIEWVLHLEWRRRVCGW